VLRRLAREGYRSGTIAAAATAGSLVAFGRAHGAAMRPLNSLAHIVLGSRAFFTGSAGVIVPPLAILVHWGSVLAWAVVFAAITGGRRDRWLYPAALGFALVTMLVDRYLMPDRLRPGFESDLSGPETSCVYLVLALSLAWGLARERMSGEALA
jgi:hypothetical protein